VLCKGVFKFFFREEGKGKREEELGVRSWELGARS
jgi:hypothetical protein